MAGVKISSIIRFDEVYIKGENMVKSLYRDLTLATTVELRVYLQDSIDIWEKYMDDAKNSKKY